MKQEMRYDEVLIELHLGRQDLIKEFARLGYFSHHTNLPIIIEEDKKHIIDSIPFQIELAFSLGNNELDKFI